jgi:hypothetical protein
MRSESSVSSDNIDCQTYQANLAEYVRLELSGQAADQVYPALAFHLEICQRCEAAYYREFRSQGQNKSLAELQQIGQRSQVAAVIQRIAPAEPVPVPDPSWGELALEYGRAWLEQETGQLRRVWLSLASLGDRLGQGAVGQPAPALTGLMGTTSVAPILGAMEVTPPDCEIKLVILTDPNSTEAESCQVEVAISLKDRFGDFSGLEVTLLWENSAQIRKTDDMGRVSFTGLPCERVGSMSLIVSLVAD